MKKEKGLTLVELAIVLVIIGIILGIGVSIIAILVKQAKQKDTKKIVQTICETVKAYAITNKTFPSDITSLGVKTTDPYGNAIVYLFATGLDTNDFCTNNGTWINLTDKGTPKNKVAFLVYSLSENRHDDTKNGSSYEIKPRGSFSGGYEYDDIYCYYDIETIRQEACETLKITTEALPVGTQYFPYPNTSIEASVSNITCTISGLPNGLTVSGCSINGTPEEAGSFQVDIQVEDSIGRQASKTFALTIHPNPIRISTTYLPYAYVGQDYTVGLTATGATGSYRWTLKDNGGLSTAYLNPTTGILSIDGSTLSSSGTYSLKVRVCDTNFPSECDEKVFTLTVVEATSGGGSSGGGGSGGGGGGSGGSCTSYTLRIIQASLFSDYIESIRTTAGCVNTTNTRFDRSFTLVPQTVELYRRSNCRNQVKTIDLAASDTDNDCKVYILCNGDRDRCIVSDTPKVYCWRALFDVDDGYGKEGGTCFRTRLITGSTTIKLYEEFRDCNNNTNLLCTYNFNQFFSLPEDSDLDCRVEIESDCSIDDD